MGWGHDLVCAKSSFVKHVQQSVDNPDDNDTDTDNDSYQGPAKFVS